MAEIQYAAPLGLMFALRNARIELRIPHIEFLPLALVIGVDENVLQPTEPVFRVFVVA